MTAEIRNHNEPTVRGEVLRARYASPEELESCWCPLCEADVVSLALSSLPPCYGREHSGPDMRGRVSRVFVREAVRSAADRVGRSPKHDRGQRTPRPHEVRIVNYTFEAAAAAVEEVVAADENCRCRCRDCRADTLTLALNRFSPLYGVSRGGRWNLPAERWRVIQEEMRRSLAAAARVVSSSPFHWAPRHNPG